jgi:hypothetical protein
MMRCQWAATAKPARARAFRVPGHSLDHAQQETQLRIARRFCQGAQQDRVSSNKFTARDFHLHQIARQFHIKPCRQSAAPDLSGGGAIAAGALHIAQPDKTLPRRLTYRAKPGQSIAPT